MHSLWKDLLFLHGHLVHQEDLAWRDDKAPARIEADIGALPLPPAPAACRDEGSCADRA